MFRKLWLKVAGRSTRQGKGLPARPARRVRPSLEALEPRYAPANLTVTTGADDGPGSLRAALTTANGNGQDDTITFDPAVTAVTLTSASLAITEPNFAVTLNGGQGNGVTVARDANAPAQFRIFNIAANVTATLANIHIMGGRAFGASGGGLLNEGRLTLRNLSLTDNRNPADPAQPFLFNPGGAIVNETAGVLALENVTVSQNRSSGGAGAISNAGTLTLADTEFSSNEAAFNGGAIDSAGTLTATNVSFVNNIAGSGGGAIINSGTLTIINGTFSGNRANEGGSALLNTGTALLRHATVTGNRANSTGGGLGSDGALSTGAGFGGPAGTLTIHNSIVAGNVTGTGTTPRDFDTTPNAVNPAAASSNNLVGDAASAGGLQNNVNGNLVGVNGAGVRDVTTVLAPLTTLNNTVLDHHPLAANSPARDAGSNAQALNAAGQPLTGDAIGNPRTANNVVDIGAIEAVQLRPGQVALANATLSIGEAGGTLAVPLTRTGGSDGSVAVSYTVAVPTTLRPRDQATPGADFQVALTGTITFAAGQTSQQLSIPITNDNLVEMDTESFVVRIQNPTGGATLGAVVETTVAIQDNDLPQVADAPRDEARLRTAAELFGKSLEHYRDFVIAAYRRYLNREPDANGLQFWVGLMQLYESSRHAQGLRQEQIEAGFLDSPEYKTRNGGAAVGETWIRAIYRDLLGREAEPGGLNFFLNQLRSGISPSQVALMFTTSLERLRNRVADTYRTLLDREPDLQGLNFWVGTFQAGGTTEDIVSGFVSSPEYYSRANRGGNNPAKWTRSAYIDVLFRPASTSEFTFWLNFLRG